MTSCEFRERLVRRAQRADVSVDERAIGQLEAYDRLLAQWNRKINLTALPLTELDDATTDRLLVDPLAAARYVSDASIRWMDIGSGGGSPALPMKIVRPLADLTLVEAKTRKAAFLREAIRVLKLDRAKADALRIQELASTGGARHSADLVSIRAVRLDPTVLAAIDFILPPGGELLLFRTTISTDFLWPPFDLVGTHRLTGPTSQLVILRKR